MEAAERLWLEAGLPHQVLDMYCTSGRWAEALSFARAHLPQQVGFCGTHGQLTEDLDCLDNKKGMLICLHSGCNVCTLTYVLPMGSMRWWVQAEGLEMEAKAAEPGVLSMAGQARLREAHAALEEEDALSAAHALLSITRQDSADCDFLSMVRLLSAMQCAVQPVCICQLLQPFSHAKSLGCSELSTMQPAPASADHHHSALINQSPSLPPQAMVWDTSDEAEPPCLAAGVAQGRVVGQDTEPHTLHGGRAGCCRAAGPHRPPCSCC